MARERIKNVWAGLLAQAGCRGGAAHLVLLDPNAETPRVLAQRARLCEETGVDALLVGGSTMRKERFQISAKAIHEAARIPVILFPGSADQVTPHADAILFLSLISGRNPDFLIGQQVLGAPAVRQSGLEVIPTGYMLIASGGMTSVQRASRTRPLSRQKPALAAAHAQAAECLGMKTVYLEAGSGARQRVPEEMIHAVARAISIPVIVGGGIRAPAQAAAAVRAGARFVVTGTIFEHRHSPDLLRRIVRSIQTGKEGT